MNRKIDTVDRQIVREVIELNRKSEIGKIWEK